MRSGPLLAHRRPLAQITAVTGVAELDTFCRFESPRQLRGYSRLVSREYSSGQPIKRGAITKSGNAHVRRVIMESAWSYPYRPWIGGFLLKRQQGLDQEVKYITSKAQRRLHTGYNKPAAAGKKKTRS